MTEGRPFYEARAGLMYVFATFSVVASVTEHLSLFSSVIVFSFHQLLNAHLSALLDNFECGGSLAVSHRYWLLIP